MSHAALRTLALSAAVATLGATNAYAQSALSAFSAAAAGSTVHIDSGTSLSGFVGRSNYDSNGVTTQYLRLELTPDTPTASVTVTAENLAYSNDWTFSTADYYGVMKSPATKINYNFSDLKSSSVTMQTTESTSFFQLPVDTFGSSYAFDLVESGPVSVGFDYKIFANDDLLELADLRYTPGSSTPILVSSAPGVSVQGAVAAPEPSEWAGLGLGAVSLGGLLLRARRRSS